MDAYIEDIKTIVAFSALVLSIFSFIFTRKSWHENNRPIISAEIKTHEGKSSGISYNIVVHNTGNRPAADIRLYAKKRYRKKLISEKSDATFIREIESVFSPMGEIALLHNGKSVVNGFGYTTGIETSPLNYGTKIPIEIKYRDLNGTQYSTQQSIILKDSDYFAGSGWAEEKA